MEEKGANRRNESMEFQYLIYRKREVGQREALLKKCGDYRITEVAAESESLRECMERCGIPAENALAIASTDQTIQEANALLTAVLAYRSPLFPRENLYGTDFLVESLDELDYYFLERVYRRKHGLPWRVIETQRCYLREITLSDLPDLFALYGQKGMTNYMEPLYGIEEELACTKAYISNMYRYYGYGMWLVKDRKTDALIGRAGFDHFESEGECLLEMGYAISVFRQRQGYGFEVCRAMLAYAKEAELGFDRIHCFVREGNAASFALLEKLGFRFQSIKLRGGRKLFCHVFDLAGKK